MPVPVSSSDSDETEGSILRGFVDENIAQQQRTFSSRSELLSQTARRQDDVPPTEGPHLNRRRRSKRPSNRELAHAEASPDELITLLIDQEHESQRLRRALLTAADRIDTESRRVADMERVNSDVADRFKILNDSRLMAQRDALKASEELRLYQFQLQTAQTEITRAQEVLRTVQTQRDEAELSAARAREKAHRLYQERIVAAAREEGRKYGFEAGFKRAHEERDFALGQAYQRRNAKSVRRRTKPNEQGRDQVEGVRLIQQPNREVVQDNYGQLSNVSSPSRLPLRGLPVETTSPEVIRIFDPSMPVPVPVPGAGVQHQQPQLEAHHPSTSQAEPIPIVHPTPEVPRTYSPSIDNYPIEIPPSAELEQRFGQNETKGKSPQLWVTANQHLEMSQQQQQQTAQEQYEGVFPPPALSVDQSRDMPHSVADSGGKRKESWYKTLRRKTFGRKNKSKALNSTAFEHSSDSWYAPGPPIHVRDFGAVVPTPRSSIDSGSVSTRMSQLDIISTPNPNGSTSGRSGKSGGGVGRRFKQNLHVIDEHPLGRETTPAKENSWHRKSEDHQDVGSSTYSDPKAVEEWRKSSASTSKAPSVASSRKPPTYIRRPAKLTVPEPLAPNARMSGPPRERIMSDNTGTSRHPRRPRSNRSSLRVVNIDEPEVSPEVEITVQPPSRSPTDAVTPSTSHRGNGYLSPHQAHQSLPTQTIRSAPSFPSVGHPSNDISSARDLADQSHWPPNGHASSSKSVRSTTQHQGSSHPNSTRSSTHNQLPPSFSNELLPRSPSYASHSLALDQPGPSRAQGRNNGATPRMSSVDVRMTPGSVRSHPLPPVNGNGGGGLSRVGSNTSLRSAGSYARYDPSTYLDPAYFVTDVTAAGNGDGNDAARPRSAASPAPRSRTHSKAGSASSYLSYVTAVL